ncbi:MAG: GHMP kinase [Armatimonadetes bacterium]|nr:GHMP kinase [Armatimonadota bacterium]
MPNQDRLRVSAPGRICLFGEHQDFLGLPVIAAAINLRFTIAGTPHDEPLFRLRMPDLGTEVSVPLPTNGELKYQRDRDYLRSSLNVLMRHGRRPTRGYDCTFRSTIPINAGTASSSAMILAWLRFLLATQGEGECDGLTLACMANRAEVLEFGEPGGIMDHVTCSLGGTLYIECRDPVQWEALPCPLDGFVLADSLTRKETTTVLAQSRCDVETGLATLREKAPEFDLQHTSLEAAEEYLSLLPVHQRRKVRANLVNRALQREGYALLKSGRVDPDRLGSLLTAHHQQLSEGLGVSTPKLDRMLEAAIAAGAKGGKLNGSGGGGAMFAYAPGRQEEVAAALEAAGGKACIVQLDEGVRLEEFAVGSPC